MANDDSMSLSPLIMVLGCFLQTLTLKNLRTKNYKYPPLSNSTHFSIRQLLQMSVVMALGLQIWRAGSQGRENDTGLAGGQKG
uniref:Uncharacterized protein n=1 Tax=Romanomermis culicivorax TaxID=13658 RepID=A0A915L8P2_ROMCU